MPRSTKRPDRAQGLHVLTRVALTFEPICKEHGLTLMQYRHLFLIAEEPMRASELADAFEVTRPLVAKSIGALTELGLVKRSPVRDDGRGVLLTVTAKGRRTLQRIEQVLLDHLDTLAGPDAVDRLLNDAVTFRGQLDDMLRREAAGERALPED
jgi:DNA-binding MarR family transcriptional regulator